MTLNEHIRVKLRPPTKKGRLHPKYDRESDIVTIESVLRRPWPHGVDIDGNIVFDLDEDRLLANLDLHIGKRLWSRGQKWSWVSDAPSHDIEFTHATLDAKSFSLPIEIRTNRRRSEIEIDFGNGIEFDTVVALSNTCQMRLNSLGLIGIHAKL